jgi:hypothetical protein
MTVCNKPKLDRLIDLYMVLRMAVYWEIILSTSLCVSEHKDM